MSSCQLLAATIQGDGPRTVVFGNGLSTSQSVWDSLLPQVPSGWRVVRFDYVGTTPPSVDAWLPHRYDSYAGHVDDLIRLLVELDARDVLFVGHSTSGMVGALASALAPERFGHLVMIGASPCYRRDADYDGGFSDDAINDLLVRAETDLAAWMGGFAPIMLGRDATPRQLEELSAALQAIRPDIANTLLRSVFLSDYRAALASVISDVSLVHGRDDVAVPLHVGRYLEQRLPCRAFYELDVPGHLPHITHPAVLAPILRQTFAAFASRPAPPPA